MQQTHLLVILLTAGLLACGGGSGEADGYGNFEATEIIISAEAHGRLKTLSIREGQQLRAGAVVGEIDCNNLALQKAQAEASLQALDDQTVDFQPEADVLDAKLKAENKRLETLYEKQDVLAVEQKRIQNLMQDEAVAAQKLDEINGQMAVLRREISAAESGRDVIVQQIASLKRSTADKNQGVLSGQQPLQKQVDLIDEQLTKCTLTNPVDGTVLEIYAEEHEFVSIGKPVYKIADLDLMQLRVYLGARQLPQIRVGQTVEVRIDAEKGMKSYQGTITWVAAEAEFTPKIIQTREERVNLVYAVDVEVENDGALKIGMPAEMWITKAESDESR